MSEVKRFCNDHNISVFLFCFIVLYSIFIAGEVQIPIISDVIFSYHAVDFSMGFCSKLIVGAIYNFFFDTVKDEYILIFESILLVGFFITLSVLLEKFIYAIEPKYRKAAFILVLFFLTGPCTFSMYVKQIGMLDVYWLFACAFFFIFLSNKKLYLFMIPLFLGTLMVHYGAIFSYIPFFVIIMLYKISCCEDKKERNMLWIVTVLSSVLAIALFIYLLLFEQDNVTYTLSEFSEIMKERGVTYNRYYEYALYRDGGEQAANYPELEKYFNTNVSTAESLINLLIIQFWVTLKSVSFTQDILPLVLISPIMFVIYKYISVIFRRDKKNYVKRFSLFCLVVLFWLTYIVSTFTSMDDLRWITHSFFPLFTSLLYILYIDRNNVEDFFENIVNNIPKNLILIYFIFYGVITIVPYC